VRHTIRISPIYIIYPTGTVILFSVVFSEIFSVYLCPETAEAARLASGAAVDLVSAVLSGEIHNGLGLVRPPGHHAMEDELNGWGYFDILTDFLQAPRLCFRLKGQCHEIFDPRFFSSIDHP
jgi:hypothetical protein